MRVSLEGIDTLCDIPIEGVVSKIDKAVAQWNEDIINICHNIRVIPSKSYLITIEIQPALAIAVA